MEKIVNIINDIVWSPALVVLLVATGLYFSFRSRFVQVRKFGTMLRLLKPGKKTEKGISSFQAMCLALSGRVGTGNIVGVATAIAFGGPGAVFWMWVIAFFGASTAFVESTLAQQYKYSHRGVFRGGPFAYIEKGLNCKWLSVVFCITTIVGCGILLSTVQANGMSAALANSFNVKPWISGCILAVLIALVIIGGIKRISKVAGIITPVMALGYVIISFIVIAINWRDIPAVFGAIFNGALGIKPVCGGILGSTIMMGVKRGLFSNEAGQGTGAIPSASAEVEHPVQQGLAQAFSVYVDTLLVCTATALMILSSGTYNIFDAKSGEMLYAGAEELGNNYVGFTQAAIDSALGGFGSAFVSIALILFVFTTVMAYYFYSESSIIHLCHMGKGISASTEKKILGCFKILMLAAIIFGAVKEANLVWMLGDIGVGMMAWINVIVIIILSPKVFKALDEFEGRGKK